MDLRNTKLLNTIFILALTCFAGAACTSAKSFPNDAGDSGGATGAGGAKATGGTTGAGGQTGGGTGGSSSSSGGAPGTGGTPGGTGGGTGAGGISGTGGGSGIAPFFTDTFESGTSGSPPGGGWDTFIAYNKNGTNPAGAILALVDTTHAHGGSKAIHVHGDGSPAMITRPLPTGTTKLYTRAWIFMIRPLGATPVNPSANHETLIGLRKVTNSAADEARFGEAKGLIGINEVPTDDFAPKLSLAPSGLSVAANKWVCIEVAFLADQPQNTLYAWADGVLIFSLTAPNQWEHSQAPTNWLSGKFTEVIMGWQSFSNFANDVWIDDVALSTARIGCQ